MKSLVLLIALLFFRLPAPSQCASGTNIFSFTYDNRTYEVVKEKKSWVDAAACATERGGYLVEINDQQEQNAAYAAIASAGIPANYTTVNDGGGVAYVWIGGTDRVTEGQWFWNGNNDPTGINFWTGEGAAGANNGASVGGHYENWGRSSSGTVNEPDNYLNQDAAAIGLAAWPAGLGTLGQPGQWNDIDELNTLYYIIEYNVKLGDIQPGVQKSINIYPNPSNGKFTIEVPSNGDLGDIAVYDILGRLVYNYNFDFGSGKTTIDLGDLCTGLYIIQLSFRGDLHKSVIMVQN